jgi:hypothetical protein
MGSRFLSGNATDLSSLADGSFALNVASAEVQSLSANLPIRTDASRELISGLIQLSDCNFVPLTNPSSTNLDLADFAITDIKELLLTANAAPSTPPAGTLTLYASGEKLMYKDDTTATFQVATSIDLAAYLLKSGGTMSGPIAMGTNNITNAGTISGAVNSRTADNIISCATSGVSGDIATFTGTAKVVQDSGTLLSSLATTASLAAYLQLAGGTMSGPIAMGSNNITNVAKITPSGTNVLYGPPAVLERIMLQSATQP